ncbi:MAG: transposase family protein, partial [Rectinemataceae bacterium]|nr:transposase family protein [Rectinemataceae bacterium]
MTIDMDDNAVTSIAQLSVLVKTAEALGVEGVKRKDDKDTVYAWMNDLLIRLRYRFLGKKEKGLIRRYLICYTGYTKTHIDHLIASYKKRGKISRRERSQPEFERVYTSMDIALLAEVALAYRHQNGKALKEVCRAMYHTYDDLRFERLAKISVSRLYDLKKTRVFLSRAGTYTKTRSVAIPIGERKKPFPEGKPGYIRVDSVHQGDLDKEKGVYHVNLVDEVTQWEVVVCVEGISEQFLLPALKEALVCFPFCIVNFHSDNGSEYINYQVATMLEKLRVTQTKSRARESGDNGLVEGKNGAVIRKWMGHAHIPRGHAPKIMLFYRLHFNSFLNYHRFCAFPDEVTDTRGKIVKQYRTYLTPCMKLCAIPRVEEYLRDGVTVASITAEAKKKTHLRVAQETEKARNTLFTSFSTKK